MRSPQRIGRGLKSVRHASGLSRSEVAARAGASREALSRLEAGQHVARTDTLTAVLDALGYELAFLPRSPQAQHLRDKTGRCTRRRRWRAPRSPQAQHLRDKARGADGR
ncbi:MAG: helix-turn-helix transcriptional regulator [Acidimicrobiaceae bacterium]|nr:helix-turn-helix transcriptional regulator [Acidimicrobiaceae bacterium]MYH44433.1 helix-turn-helix transcriptional regulator [Acidimicrobiaceae bacterium]MYI52726.1 helix-turn-helix transcriptional regulator [Acidimicrobiaceae bacterium]